MSTTQSSEVRERLAREDANFQRLVSKHHDCETRLQELQDRRFLSPEEQQEEVELKKKKLSLKDQMEQIVRLAVD